MPAIYRIIGQQQEILAYVPFLQFSDIKFTFELQIDFVLTHFGLNFHTSKLSTCQVVGQKLPKTTMLAFLAHYVHDSRAIVTH